MVSLAELSHVASVASVVTCCLLMLGFLLRLCGQDLLNGGVVGWNDERRHNILSKLFSKAGPGTTNVLPIDLFVGVTKVSAIDSGTKLTFRFRTTGIRSIRIRPYWGVSVSIFHHVLKSPWPWFKEAFLRGNLFGSEGCSMLGDIQTCSSDWLSGDPLGATGQFPKRRVIVNVTKPDGKPIEDLGPAPRQIYPLVLVVLPGEDDFYKENRDGNVGAFIVIVHIKDSVCRIASHILATYLKHTTPESKVSLPVATHLIPIYATLNVENDKELSSSDDELDISQKSSRRKKRNICVVCQELPVTRCTLPCKHACTCQRCFKRLNNRCPMCRTMISSYFLVGDESDQAIAEAEARDKAEEEERLRNRPRTMAQRLGEWNERFARAAGLIEN